MNGISRLVPAVVWQRHLSGTANVYHSMVREKRAFECTMPVFTPRHYFLISEMFAIFTDYCHTPTPTVPVWPNVTFIAQASLRPQEPLHIVIKFWYYDAY